MLNPYVFLYVQVNIMPRGKRNPGKYIYVMAGLRNKWSSNTWNNFELYHRIFIIEVEFNKDSMFIYKIKPRALSD